MLLVGMAGTAPAQFFDIHFEIGLPAPDCTPQPSYHFPYEAPGCYTFGEVSQWRDDGEAVVEADVADMPADCAEACFEETVMRYERRYGPPSEVEYAREHCELSRTATWDFSEFFLEVSLVLEPEEGTLEVVAGEE